MTTIETYPQLVEALDARRRALALTHDILSERAGLPERYSSKVSCFDRRLGPLSMPCLLGALGLELVAEETSAA